MASKLNLKLRGIRAPRVAITLEQQLEEAKVKMMLILQVMAIITDPVRTAQMQQELDEATANHARLTALIESRNNETPQI